MFQSAILLKNLDPMHTAYFAFLRRLILFTILIGLAGWGIIQLLPSPGASPMYPFILVFFFSFTLLQHRYIFRSGAEKLSKFANRFMMLTFLKLALYLFIILFYVVLINQDDAIPFLITFLTIYICFTVFEVIEMLRASRQQGKNVND